MNVLIIGLGSIGKRHLANIKEHQEEWGIEAITVYDTLMRTMTKHRDSVYYADRIPDGSFDAVLVCTPPKYHFKYAAIYPGAHVLVEKPVDFNQDWEGEGDRVRAAMNLRFHPGTQFIKDAFEGSQIKSIRMWYSYNSVRTSSPDYALGPVLSCLHDIDAMSWALDRKNIKVEHVHSAPEVKSEIAVGTCTKSDFSRRPLGWATPSAMWQLSADFIGLRRMRGLQVITQRQQLEWASFGDGDNEHVQLAHQKWDADMEMTSKDIPINEMFVNMLKEFFDMVNAKTPAEDCILPPAWQVAELASRFYNYRTPEAKNYELR